MAQSTDHFTQTAFLGFSSSIDCIFIFIYPFLTHPSTLLHSNGQQAIQSSVVVDSNRTLFVRGTWLHHKEEIKECFGVEGESRWPCKIGAVGADASGFKGIIGGWSTGVRRRSAGGSNGTTKTSPGQSAKQHINQINIHKNRRVIGLKHCTQRSTNRTVTSQPTHQLPETSAIKWQPTVRTGIQINAEIKSHSYGSFGGQIKEGLC